MSTITTTAADTVAVPSSQDVTTPKANKVPKAKPLPSTIVSNIRSACVALSSHEVIGKLLEYRQFNASGSFVMKLPSFKDAVATLPQSAEAKVALNLLKETRKAVESITGSAKQTWVLHSSGAFGLYSKFNG